MKLFEVTTRKHAVISAKEAMQDPYKAYLYAHDTLKRRRFPEGEPAIATNPEWSYFYAREILDGRFKQGESAILQSPMYSFLYARDVLKHEWPQAEKVIMSDARWGEQYTKFVQSLKK